MDDAENIHASPDVKTINNKGGEGRSKKTMDDAEIIPVPVKEQSIRTIAANQDKPSISSLLLRELASSVETLEGPAYGSAGSTTIAARSTVEFLGTVIREVPPRTTPIQFLRELEKRLRVKHRIHITACHLRSAIHSKFRNLGDSIPIKQLTKGMSKTSC